MTRAEKTTRLQKTGPERITKTPTGIRGLDEITDGGLPSGRPTLVCGAAGCGKTLFGAEFLARGATRFGEPGVLMAFEETQDELVGNVASLGLDLKELIRKRQLVVDSVRIERSEIEETGEYDLEGLFVRLNHAIQTVGARRVVLDTLEALFAGLPNEAILRAELRRLFRWLKEKKVTAVITAERGREHLTRHGLEEYVSDCVILLDHRVHQGIATRHLRVVKYRGTQHGTNEYPFLIGNDGFNVLPITSLRLDHKAPTTRISSGIPRLDTMLGGKGFYRGSSILLTGTPGTGKTSTASTFAEAAARRGERVLYFAFEESPSQIIRNMQSIGLRLDTHVRDGRLKFHSARPTMFGLEMHLTTMVREIEEFRPAVVIVDPITSLLAVGTEFETKSMVTRLLDWLKAAGITSLYTSLSHGEIREEALSEVAISSLMDAWLDVVNMEGNGERNRGIYILKSRGMAHSNQIREFVITGRGIDLIDAYVGPGGVLTGSARAAQTAREKADALAQEQEAERRRQQSLRRRDELERQITALRFEQESEEQDVRRSRDQSRERGRALDADKTMLARLRHVASEKASAPKNGRVAGRRDS